MDYLYMGCKLKYIDTDDTYVIDEDAFLQYRRVKSESLKKKDEADLKLYNDALHNYFEWYISYCDEIIGGKTIKDEHIVPHVFRAEIKSAHQFAEFLKKSIYISKQYVQNLNSKINEDNILRYRHTLGNLDADLEWLIANYEISVRKSVSKISLKSWRRPYLSPTDIYSAAKTLFFIEEATKIEDLYLRDIKPVVMFQIRQMIEIFGKQLLGYVSITDSRGATVKKFTQVAWDFIQVELKKGTASRISLPFDLNQIISIYKWSNSFVHSTYIYSSFVQFYALQVLKLLFVRSGTYIKTYDGKATEKYNIADIIIRDYHSLRKDFEEYLRKSKPDVVVDWLPEKHVDAYIISL